MRLWSRLWQSFKVEADWERLNDYASLDLEGARRLLSPSRISVHSIVLLDEGKANTNFLIETQDGPRVLRLHGLQGDRLDASWLAPLDVPTPELFASSARWSLYEWKPGISLERALLHKRALPYEQIARQLARVRLAMNGRLCRSAGFFDSELPLNAFDLSGNHDNPLIVKDAWPSAIEGLLGYLRQLLRGVKLSKESKARIARVVDDAEPRLQAIAGPPVLVHGDFKLSNLLVDETGLTAVLDWEFTHAGTWLSDVGQLLRHPESLPDGFTQAFLDEINAPEDTMLLARTLDFVNLVDFLHKEKDQPKMRTDVTRRIEEVCDLYQNRFG